MKNTIIAKDLNDLRVIIENEINIYGHKCDLNHIDISNVRDMTGLFHESKFNGDISKWDMSHVDDIGYMFYESKFNGDISSWNVSNITYMSHAFMHSKFNKDISKWDVSKVESMDYMFFGSKIQHSIDDWKIYSLQNLSSMFRHSAFEKTNKIPFWYLDTYDERINSILKSKVEQEQNFIESILNVNDYSSQRMKKKL